MVPPGQGFSPVRRKHTHERSYTIMVMGGTGKVRSFRISRRVLLWAVLFFAAYVPFSVYLVNRYIDLRHANLAQRQRVERLERDLIRSDHAVSKSRDYIVFLEDYIFQTEKQPEGTVEPARLPDKPGAPAAPEPSNEQPREQDQRVSIEDLVLDKQGGKLAVTFKLVNLNPGASSVGGYVYMLARSKESLSRPEWTYPQVKLVDGFPETFRRGKVFLIQKFKHMKGNLTVGSGQDAPSTLQILVYDQTGTILLTKDFEIPHTP